MPHAGICAGGWPQPDSSGQGQSLPRSVMMDRTTQPVRSEGPLLHRCTTEMWRDPDECRTLG